MATLELSPPAERGPLQRVARPTGWGARVPLTLGFGLLILATYAVFAHGAVQPTTLTSPTEPRLEVAIAALAIAAAAAGLWTGALRGSTAGGIRPAAGLLAAFTAWSAITVLWSVAPALTWVEFNRDLAYLIVLGLAVAFGASTPRALTLAGTGFLILTGAVTLYALGQKLLPGIHVGSVLDLNQTGGDPRLQAPLDYFNALALLLAMGAPVALAAGARAGLDHRLRLAALIELQLMLVTIAFTESRGGVIALAVGLAVCIGLGSSPLRLLMWTGVAFVLALPALVLGFASHALSGTGIGLGERERAGLLLCVVVVAFGVLLVLFAGRLFELEAASELAPDQRRRIWRGLILAADAAILLALVAVAVSSRGLPGEIAHFWHDFTTAHVGNRNNLLSTDSSNRWVWWKEALGAFSERPLSGWGAGSFAVVHLLFRHDTLNVTHAHSVPLEWLAETGLIGAALVIASWILLLRCGVAAVRARIGTAERFLAAAMLGAGAAYTVHACIDWDWDIPGVTLPVLVLLGVLAGSLRTAPGRTSAPAPSGVGGGSAAGGPGLRLLALVAVTIACSLFAISAVLPELAASRAAAAFVQASRGSAGALRQASVDAAAATALDPLADDGPLAESTIAFRRGQIRLARLDALEAVEREPADFRSWNQLAILDVDLGDLNQARTAAQGLLEDDPEDPTVVQAAEQLAQEAEIGAAPPQDSGTSVSTP